MSRIVTCGLFAAAVGWFGCDTEHVVGTPSDAAVPLSADGGAPDGGTRDGGVDAGWPDAGSADGAVDAGSAGPDAGACAVDVCPAPNGGIAWACERRFALGNNWAWWNFGADFGGIAGWNAPGVAEATATFGADLGQMRDAGSSVIRWWMFPILRSDGITFGADGAPSGIGGTLVADVQAALALAEQNDVYLMLTLFSFDGFNPSTLQTGNDTYSLQPIVISPSKTAELVQNLVAPVADAVESSPYRQRMLAWDIINEPEWAMYGKDMYGSDIFGWDPLSSKLLPVDHAQMETFLNAVADTLHAHSSALVTVGSAAIEWAPAWTHTHLDFYQLHYYGWVYQLYPYTTVTLQSVGLTDKPVMIGEFPITGFTGVVGRPNLTAQQYEEAMWQYGYAGTLAWAFNDASFPWTPAAIGGFAGEHPCETQFSSSGASRTPRLAEQEAPAPRSFSSATSAEEESYARMRGLVELRQVAAARAEAERFFERFPESPWGAQVFELTGVHPRPTAGR